MKSYPTHDGPFPERLYFTNREIEDICADELRRVGLMPQAPQPIRIDRFVEKRFRVVPTYQDLPVGLLGYTKFGRSGVQAIVVSKALADEGTKTSERRVNTTLAHESGHGLLHMQLFVFDTIKGGARLITDDVDYGQRKIMCRPEAVDDGHATRRYDGRWWELQANRAIGGLLLPRHLVALALEPVTSVKGLLETRVLASEMRLNAVQVLVDTFDVNAAVARIRLGQLFPESAAAQLTF